MLDLPLNIAVL